MSCVVIGKPINQEIPLLVDGVDNDVIAKNEKEENT